MKRNESQISSKAISTTPSLQEYCPPRVHSHHKYESLLYFITSFMNDCQLYVLELKELVYNFVGINLNFPHPTSKSPSDNECEHCQVQCLIKNCRNTREDLIRILALLRGHKNGVDPSVYMQFKESYKQNMNKMDMEKESKQKQQKIDEFMKRPLKFEQNCQLNNMGMLTFRQMATSRDCDKENKNWLSRFGIMQQNIQTSQSQDNAPKSKEELEQRGGKIKNSGMSHCLGWENQFEKAYCLIRLIKHQIQQSQFDGREDIGNTNQFKPANSEQKAVASV